MLKEHPKGLLVAFFSNMGERFGFYTMMAILVLFLQAKYGLTESQAGGYYSWFYFGIYALALIGGILADATRKYKFVILMGIIIMFAGYVVMAIPGNPLAITLTGLFTIALGNGLFKGNLQAVVGQMYDDPRYSKVRDSAFMIFYMGINIGAFFAPFVATGIRNWFLKTQGFEHDGSLPAMCHAYTNGTLENTEAFQSLAEKVSGKVVTDLGAFASDYINAFSKGYNYAFGIAAGAMVISMLVYIIFNKLLPSVEKVVTKDNKAENKAKGNLVSFLLAAGLMATTSVIFYFVMNDLALGMAVGLFVGFVAMMFQISTKEERPRVTSLLLVFIVVIFFWMSFHQNGLTLTFFARDYTVKEVGAFTNIFFNLESILSFIGAIAGVVLVLFNKKSFNKLIGGAMAIVFGGLTYYFVSGFAESNPIAPEVFQSFNPLFIVSLTFPVMAVFTWLRNKNLEPSTPKKIGIGMFIAALGFLVILIASIGLVSPHELQVIENGSTKYNPVPDSSRVIPYWLISSYLILTIAELFLSPMGLSFVSKVAPARFQGLMQGGWLLATAVGNKFLFIGSDFWGKLDLWQLWSIFIVCCVLSAVFIFSIMKRLEAATK
ncbi:MAG: peptide MFS transporter [Bacteroidales bacterium]|jgi:POT family proton-dependent oligopeptide transporter|nr:peptide MFS transporter [Bacteroidales bacterium]